MSAQWQEKSILFRDVRSVSIQHSTGMEYKKRPSGIEVNAGPTKSKKEERASLVHRRVAIAGDSQQCAAVKVRFLDAIVASADGLSLFGMHYRPYWIMSDVAALSALAYAWAFSKRFPSVSGVGLGLAVLIALIVYKLVLEVKAALGKSAARSFLQDCLQVILPCFLIVSFLFRQPLSLTFAFLGTLLPLYGCLARIGCFLGGCCYGKPSTKGVLYPKSVFESTGHGCRRYSPSPDPAIRVFPIQLAEAAAQATLFATLATLLWHVPSTARSIFWLYLSLYSIVRFVLDFYRTTSARPRYGRFSEAQLVCVGVQVVVVGVLLQR